MLVAVLSGFCLALAAPLLAWALKRAAGPIQAILPAFLFAYLLQFVPEAALGRPWRFTLPWDVASGLALSFRADGLSLTFGLVLTLLAAALLGATATGEFGDAVRARLLVALNALFASALGLTFADQPVLMASFAASLSLAVFLAVTVEGGAETRARALGLLLAWLFCDLLLLALLVRLFIDVPGGVFGAAGFSSLTANGRFEPVWLLPILFLKIGAMVLALASRRLASPSPALAALAGLALPALLCLLLRFSPIFPETARIGLIALAIGGSLAGVMIGMGARRVVVVLAALTLASFSAAVLQIGLATDGALAAALLSGATGALGLVAIYLLVPADLDLKALRSAIAGTPLGASVLIFALLVLAGLTPSTGLLALFASARSAFDYEPALAAGSATILAHGVSIAIALRIAAALAFGEVGGAAAQPRAVALAAAAALTAIAIVAGCAPELVAKVLVAPAIRTGYEASLGVVNLQAAGLIAGSIGLAALLLWQRSLLARLLEFLSRRLPKRLSLLGALLARVRRTARAERSAPALFMASSAGLTAVAAAGAAALAWPRTAFSFAPVDAVAAALVLAALIAGGIAIAQRRFAPAVPVVAIAGVLTILGVLALGALELGFVMLLVLLIQTIVLLILSARSTDDPAAGEPGIAPVARIALAAVAGIGTALAAFGAGLPPAHAVGEPAGITGLVTASGLALREAGLTAIQRWSGVVLVLLVLGVAVADLSGRARGETR